MNIFFVTEGSCKCNTFLNRQALMQNELTFFDNLLINRQALMQNESDILIIF